MGARWAPVCWEYIDDYRILALVALEATALRSGPAFRSVGLAKARGDLLAQLVRYGLPGGDVFVEPDLGKWGVLVEATTSACRRKGLRVQGLLALVSAWSGLSLVHRPARSFFDAVGKAMQEHVGDHELATWPSLKCELRGLFRRASQSPVRGALAFGHQEDHLARMAQTQGRWLVAESINKALGDEVGLCLAAFATAGEGTAAKIRAVLRRGSAWGQKLLVIAGSAVAIGVVSKGRSKSMSLNAIPRCLAAYMLGYRATVYSQWASSGGGEVQCECEMVHALADAPEAAEERAAGCWAMALDVDVLCDEGEIGTGEGESVQGSLIAVRILMAIIGMMVYCGEAGSVAADAAGLAFDCYLGEQGWEMMRVADVVAAGGVMAIGLGVHVRGERGKPSQEQGVLLEYLGHQAEETLKEKPKETTKEVEDASPEEAEEGEEAVADEAEDVAEEDEEENEEAAGPSGDRAPRRTEGARRAGGGWGGALGADSAAAWVEGSASHGGFPENPSASQGVHPGVAVARRGDSGSPGWPSLRRTRRRLGSVEVLGVTVLESVVLLEFATLHGIMLLGSVLVGLGRCWSVWLGVACGVAGRSRLAVRAGASFWSVWVAVDSGGACRSQLVVGCRSVWVDVACGVAGAAAGVSVVHVTLVVLFSLVRLAHVLVGKLLRVSVVLVALVVLPSLVRLAHVLVGELLLVSVVLVILEVLLSLVRLAHVLVGELLLVSVVLVILVVLLSLVRLAHVLVGALLLVSVVLVPFVVQLSLVRLARVLVGKLLRVSVVYVTLVVLLSILRFARVLVGKLLRVAVVLVALGMLLSLVRLAHVLVGKLLLVSVVLVTLVMLLLLVRLAPVLVGKLLHVSVVLVTLSVLLSFILLAHVLAGKLLLVSVVLLTLVMVFSLVRLAHVLVGELLLVSVVLVTLMVLLSFVRLTPVLVGKLLRVSVVLVILEVLLSLVRLAHALVGKLLLVLVVLGILVMLLSLVRLAHVLGAGSEDPGCADGDAGVGALGSAGGDAGVSTPGFAGGASGVGAPCRAGGDADVYAPRWAGKEVGVGALRSAATAGPVALASARPGGPPGTVTAAAAAAAARERAAAAAHRPATAAAAAASAAAPEAPAAHQALAACAAAPARRAAHAAAAARTAPAAAAATPAAPGTHAAAAALAAPAAATAPAAPAATAVSKAQCGRAAPPRASICARGSEFSALAESAGAWAGTSTSPQIWDPGGERFETPTLCRDGELQRRLSATPQWQPRRLVRVGMAEEGAAAPEKPAPTQLHAGSRRVAGLPSEVLEDWRCINAQFQEALRRSAAPSTRPALGEAAPGGASARGAAARGAAPGGRGARGEIEVGGRSFLLDEAIGQGAFGVVYRAHERCGAGDRAVAVKRVAAGDRGASAAACLEAQLLESLSARLPHASRRRIPGYVAHGPDADSGEPAVYIAMALVPGQVLDRWLYGIADEQHKHLEVAQLAGGRLPDGRQRSLRLAGAVAVASALVSQLAEVFKELEPMAFHRDVSSHNIMIDTDRFDGGDRPRFTLIDFGLAVRSDTWAAESRVSNLAGDPRYWPPAAWMAFAYGFGYLDMQGSGGFCRQYAERIDHYSFGILGLELLFGLWDTESATDGAVPLAMRRARSAWQLLWVEVLTLFQTFHVQGPQATRQRIGLTSDEGIVRLTGLLAGLRGELRAVAAAAVAGTGEDRELAWLCLTLADLVDENGSLSWADVVAGSCTPHCAAALAASSPPLAPRAPSGGATAGPQTPPARWRAAVTAVPLRALGSPSSPGLLVAQTPPAPCQSAVTAAPLRALGTAGGSDAAGTQSIRCDRSAAAGAWVAAGAALAAGGSGCSAAGAATTPCKAALGRVARGGAAARAGAAGRPARAWRGGPAAPAGRGGAAPAGRGGRARRGARPEASAQQVALRPAASTPPRERPRHSPAPHASARRFGGGPPRHAPARYPDGQARPRGPPVADGPGGRGPRPRQTTWAAIPRAPLDELPGRAEGTSCSSNSTVGQSLYNASVVSEDPWARVAYVASEIGLATYGGVPVRTGLRLSQLEGRVVVVRNALGVPAACGILQAMMAALLPSLLATITILMTMPVDVTVIAMVNFRVAADLDPQTSPEVFAGPAEPFGLFWGAWRNRGPLLSTLSVFDQGMQTRRAAAAAASAARGGAGGLAGAMERQRQSRLRNRQRCRRAGAALRGRRGRRQDRRSIVQFTTGVAYVEEKEAKVEIGVMRIGCLQTECSVTYCTKEETEDTERRYDQIEPTLLTFKPNEYFKTIYLQLRDNDSFNDIVEAKLALENPKHCTLGIELRRMRVKIIDDDWFPSAKFRKEIEEDYTTDNWRTGRDFEMMMEFWKFAFKQTMPGSIYILVADQVKNAIFILNLTVNKMVIGLIADTDWSGEMSSADRWSAVRELLLLALLLTLPYGISHWLVYRRQFWKVGGGARGTLLNSLIDKYLYYEDRRDVALFCGAATTFVFALIFIS
ncbi:unnamed protein product [Prorocentrum cordatum]|uniref:NEK6-subfamily protein kinase n=1 Tax=Prorocentrum cordatum TaxID=2364126 RepID=A0ABN9TV84_9DINO|nr:unnamed protein product [Polarella glacialis]